LTLEKTTVTTIAKGLTPISEFFFSIRTWFGNVSRLSSGHRHTPATAIRTATLRCKGLVSRRLGDEMRVDPADTRYIGTCISMRAGISFFNQRNSIPGHFIENAPRIPGSC